MKHSGYLFIMMMACTLGACTNDDKACTTRADELAAKEQALNQREQQLNEREKQMSANSTNANQMNGTSDSSMTANANAGSSKAGNASGSEPSLFRRNRSRTGYAHSNTPGQFPEGTDRLLAERDLEYLSPWGMKVITNEIYARHGMRFTDPELKRHFDEEKWYHQRTGNVNGSLTKTERQNLDFIANYKAQAE